MVPIPFRQSRFDKGMFSRESLDMWGPGRSIHRRRGARGHALAVCAILHQGHARLGLLDFDEPFIRLYNQGHILSEGEKMSKSRGNVVAPDEYVGKYGADAVRCYLMFIGPWDRGGSWQDTGINGVSRWLTACGRSPSGTPGS